MYAITYVIVFYIKLQAKKLSYVPLRDTRENTSRNLRKEEEDRMCFVGMLTTQEHSLCRKDVGMALYFITRKR